MSRTEMYRLEFIDHGQHVQAIIYDGLGTVMADVAGINDLNARAAAFVEVGQKMSADRENAAQVNPEGVRLYGGMGNEPRDG